ncbi:MULTISPECIES: YdaS family helix-turn-helix protein [Symbiopectobacterium]|uniref:Helix-turn-helix domain-containing protein n=1 Tax=Symbiopectobacterium purcellii TaxID=2871826 RepID=A0ABX9ARF7_9ENTR|nr:MULTISPECIES: YdaS family helix-turn-helix protein [Symbiopectobacterium]QZN96360.1 helix-turn-helix domain-containing protein [Symbiopectobacterium purcellii]
MRLKEYLSSLDTGGHKAFAKALGVSPSFLCQMASGKSSVSPARCVEIERISNGVVPRKELRNDWEKIWPELQAA